MMVPHQRVNLVARGALLCSLGTGANPNEKTAWLRFFLLRRGFHGLRLWVPPKVFAQQHLKMPRLHLFV